jgi:hypothetical protein
MAQLQQPPSQPQPQPSVAMPKNKPTKKRNRTVKLPEDEEKRKSFLERNRIGKTTL